MANETSLCRLRRPPWRAICFCVVFFLLLNVQMVYASDIYVVINNSIVYFPDQQPFIDSNNRILVPVRFVSEKLGGTVQWDPSAQRVIIDYDGGQIRLVTNNSKAVITSGTIEKQVDMGTATTIVNNRLMVPLRFISEVMGLDVSWDQFTNSVSLEREKSSGLNVKLLESFKNLDENINKLISKREGYYVLKKWKNDNVNIESSGKYEDVVVSVDPKKLADSFMFEFDAQNSENISWISIYFATDSNQSNFFYYDITPNVLQNKNYVIVNKEQLLVGKGSPTWDKVKYFRVAIQSKNGLNFSIKPSSLSTFASGKPMITLWFDDGWENSYTNAYRIASKVDPTIKGVIPIIPFAIETDGYLSKEQLKLLKNAGWELVNHSYSHHYLMDLSDEQIRIQVEKAINFISEYDSIGAYHFAVPYSTADERVLNILKNYVLSIRYLGETVDPIFFDPYRIGYKEVTNLTSFETVREWVDEAIKNKQWLNLMFHRIEDPANDRYTYGTQEFEKLVYYLSFMKDHIKVATITEAFKEIGMPIDKLN